MIPIASNVRIWLATGHTDMRCGMHRLALLVQEGLGREPFGGDIFIFRGRSGKQATFSIQFSHGQDRLPLAPIIRTDVAGVVASTREGSAMHLHRRTARP
jgi:transposase